MQPSLTGLSLLSCSWSTSQPNGNGFLYGANIFIKPILGQRDYPYKSQLLDILAFLGACNSIIYLRNASNLNVHKLNFKTSHRHQKKNKSHPHPNPLILRLCRHWNLQLCLLEDCRTSINTRGQRYGAANGGLPEHQKMGGEGALKMVPKKMEGNFSNIALKRKSSYLFGSSQSTESPFEDLWKIFSDFKAGGSTPCISVYLHYVQQ